MWVEEMHVGVGSEQICKSYAEDQGQLQMDS